MSSRVDKIMLEIAYLSVRELNELIWRFKELSGDDPPSSGVREPRKPRPSRPRHGAEAPLEHDD